VRKKIGDLRHTLPAGIVGPGFNDDFGDVFGVIYALTSDGFTYRELRDYAEFVRAEEFPFRLLSDQDHALAVAVGAARSTAQSTASRISYLVGPDGRVRRTYGEVTPASHAGQVLDDFDADAKR